MNEHYAKWIRDYEERHAVNVHGNTHEERIATGVRAMCGSATEDMVATFPELRRVRGHYGYHTHWWCVTPDGEIVDPTAKQFPPGLEYKEYTGPDPVGKCMWCGELVWNYDYGSSACSKDCLMSLEQEYSNC